MVAADGYPAELYARLHTGNEGDVSFYVDSCADVGRILELGCGQGRIAGELVAAGHDVVGIDIDESALLRAQQRGVSVFLADMAEFDLGQQFDVVIAPYNALYCLLTDQALGDCLRKVVKHLRSGGRFIFDVYHADHLERAEYATLDTAEAWIGTIDFDGQTWDVYEASVRADGGRQIEVTYRHVSHADSRELEAVLHHRYFLRHEIETMLLACGFDVQACMDAFPNASISPDERMLIIESMLR